MQSLTLGFSKHALDDELGDAEYCDVCLKDVCSFLPATQWIFGDYAAEAKGRKRKRKNTVAVLLFATCGV